jgi:DNA-binding response OmpR family regulator
MQLMQSSKRGRTALVVEDEWLLRMELVDEMSAAGWSVSEASAGEAALALLEATHFDLLVTDIRLPGPVDGWQVAEAFREASPMGGVVYVSANPDLPHRRVRDSVFLGKPCNIDRLLETCAQLTSG